MSRTSASSTSSTSGSLSPTMVVAPSITPQYNEFILDLMDRIKHESKRWSFGDRLGVAFHFTGERLFKQNNVVNRAGIRTRQEIRNVPPFFTKLHSALLQNPFVIVELCGTAEANLMYCHSKLVKLEPKRSVLLIGAVSLVKGHFNNYFADSVPLEPGTMVKLYSRTYDIRVSSNSHSIFIRTEDIVKGRVKLASTQEEQVESSAVKEDDMENSDDSSTDWEDDHQSYDTAESTFDEDDNSNDGSRRSARNGSRPGSSRIPSPFGPGRARARMVDASTQTDNPRQTDFDTLLAEAQEMQRIGRRPHSN